MPNNPEPQSLLASLQSMRLTDEEKKQDRDLLEAVSSASDLHRVLAAEDLRLHPSEKAMIRANLLRAMDARRMPLRGGKSRFVRAVFSRTLATAMAAIVIVVTSGNALVSAAEAAIPGDLLYGFKMQINERVLAAFSSDQAWALAKVERRLTEAQYAAGRTALSPEQEHKVLAAVSAAFSEAEKNASRFPGEEKTAFLDALRTLRETELDSAALLPSEAPATVGTLNDVRRIQTRGIISDRGVKSSAAGLFPDSSASSGESASPEGTAEPAAPEEESAAVELPVVNDTAEPVSSAAALIPDVTSAPDLLPSEGKDAELPSVGL